MATITLYKDKVNGVGSLLDDIIKSSNNLSVQLGTLKNTLQGVDSSTCNLQDTVDSISSSSKSEDDKVEDLKTLNNKLTEFIEMTANRDSSAKDEINEAKEEFYTKYSYLKPDCEKSTWERIKDGIKSACEWCKKHWKEIVAVILIIAAVVVVIVTAGAALGPIMGIVAAVAKGVLVGAALGAAFGGAQGYAKYGVNGILPGIINGATDGAIMGGVFGLIGGVGALAGGFLGCSTFMEGLFAFSSKLTYGMLGFDVLATLNDVQTRFQKDTGINLGLIDPNVGRFISDLNHKAHENPYYNALQLTVGGIAAFSGGYVNNAKCFIAGTLVSTVNGFVAIENIKAGDMVYAAHEETLEYGIRPVVETYVRETDTLVHITVGGEEIISTVDHPYFVKNKGFVKAIDLCIGFELMDNNGNTLVVEQIFRETLHDETVKVYNFQVEEYHTYYVGDSCLLVHNAGTGYTSPSDQAKSWQGKGKYPGVDDYTDVTVNKGTVLYRGEPKGSEFFTTLDAVEGSGRSATTIFEGLQVEKNPIYGYRSEMQGYVFNEDVAAAYGITNANPQFGAGGLPQYFVPDVQTLIDNGILVPVDNIPLTP